MPTWNVHLAVAKKIAKELDIKEKDIFMLANLFPDYDKVSKEITHYLTTKINRKENLPNLDRFTNKYKDKFTNPVILGYLTHLLTDYYFNKITYNEHYIYNDNEELIGMKLKNGKEKYAKDVKNLTKIKHSDFKLFGEYLAKNRYISIPKYDSKILDYKKDLKEVDISEEEIIKLTNYLKKNILKHFSVIRKRYVIYTRKILMEHFDYVIEFILKYITDNNIKYKQEEG